MKSMFKIVKLIIAFLFLLSAYAYFGTSQSDYISLMFGLLVGFYILVMADNDFKKIKEKRGR